MSDDPVEARPFAPQRTGGSAARTLLFQCCLPVVVITFSTSLIRINQLLMLPEHFPYPTVLVLMHCVFCSLFAMLLLWLRPSLFPSLKDPDRKSDISLHFYVNSILPIALCFAGSLVLSNLAYKYCTVAFLQMIKEGNMMVVYALSYVAGVETFTLTKLGILVVMLMATWVCVDGELNFSFLGFAVQATGGLCEAIKTIMQSLLLAGQGVRLDPMSMVLLLMPMCGLFLSSLILFHIMVANLSFVSLPSSGEIWTYCWLLTLSVCNAFALNVAIAIFLKHLSPVSYILTGNVKDIVVVCMSTLMVGERISSTQLMGFSFQVACIFAWTSYKQTGLLFPKELILQVLDTVTTSENGENTEKEENTEKVESPKKGESDEK